MFCFVPKIRIKSFSTLVIYTIKNKYESLHLDKLCLDSQSSKYLF